MIEISQGAVNSVIHLSKKLLVVPERAAIPGTRVRATGISFGSCSERELQVYSRIEQTQFKYTFSSDGPPQKYFFYTLWKACANKLLYIQIQVVSLRTEIGKCNIN